MHTHLRCCTSDPGARLVDLPDVETLILLQTLLKLIGSKTLCQDALTSFIKPDCFKCGCEVGMCGVEGSE